MFQNKTEHIFGLIPILVILIMRPGAIKFRKALVNLFILFLLHTIFPGASFQIFFSREMFSRTSRSDITITFIFNFENSLAS